MHNPCFESKVDRWVALLLLAPVFVALVAAIMLFAQGQPGDASIVALSGAGVMLVTGLFTIPCRYTFLDDTLSVRCGLICVHVPYDSITSAEKSSTWRSGLALSLCRIEITSTVRSVIISPADRDRFLDELHRRSSQLAHGNDDGDA